MLTFLMKKPFSKTKIKNGTMLHFYKSLHVWLKRRKAGFSHLSLICSHGMLYGLKFVKRS